MTLHSHVLRIRFAAFLLLIIAAGAIAASQPDILVIMPDQMRGDCMSIVGHPVVQTPHLDKLAEQGALFRRAYTTVPSCIPARYALLTGLYPQTTGIVGFKSHPITEPTLPQLLSGAGYKTILVGRDMHQVPKEAPYGYQKILTGSTYISDDNYDVDLRKAAPQTGGIGKLVDGMELTRNGWEAKPWPVQNELHPTAWIVRHARDTLAEAPPEKPLFLTASFYAPHPPLFPPKEYFDRYLKKKLPAPARGDWVDWAKVPPPKKLSAADRVLLEGETLQEAQAGYYGLISHLDDQIAPLIDDFKARCKKLKHAWVIVFITDHGEMMGDHGYFRKCEPYEGSANIPFIIAGSAEMGFKQGLRSQEIVCLEDVMPTLLDLAGAKIPTPMDGVSLVPVLRGEAKTTREVLHLEHAPCYSKEQSFHALTDKRYKYVWRPLDGTDQLFDLQTDVREEHDLTKDPSKKELVATWRARMVEQLAGRPEGFSDGKKLIAGRPYLPIQKLKTP